MRRPLLALLIALALLGCSQGEVRPDDPEDRSQVQAVPTQTPAPEHDGPPVPDPEPPPAEDVAQLEPGRTDEAEVAGEPALLALGDSIAAGTGLAERREGFVWRVHRAIAEEREADYGMANLAMPGASSSSLLEGEQLAAGLAVLEDREVDTVVISVGGNDLLGLFRGPCAEGLGTQACLDAIDGAVADYGRNLEAIFRQLREAEPRAAIVLLAVYNPFDLGLGSQLEVRAAEANAALNAAGAEAAAAHGIAVADGYAALEGRIGTTTGMAATQPDIHPTPLGHDRLALAVLEALRE